ncbi:unnamed protein product [Dovyalis caffra]|uniref:Coiled-coil SMC6 And NSE5 INteracting (CANIN) domain-containing protein n=1 Tax=Dovyalis caffra TaxID=77055 RepID=A0AAV1RDN8_9ROSI|nr:unnamed protein product [Dovyalis caffra]
MDAPIDFEFEDALLNSPVIVKKRKKVIGLDDLLTDYYNEKSKVIEKESKRANAKKNYDSDEDDFGKEALLSKQINECHNQMKEMSGEEEISTWGLHVFGDQKPLPLLTLPELGSCSLLQSFMSSELNSLVELTTEKGETFLEGLLVNDWLSKLVSAHGYVENSIAKWTFYLMLYSSKEELRASACDFWCNILLPWDKYDGSISMLNQTEKLPIRIEWFPKYSELRSALETYGFFSIFCHGQNQSKQPVFSASEAEELVEVAVFLSSDRQLEGLLVLLDEFVQSVISYFTEEEWNRSCEKIARTLACSINTVGYSNAVSGVDSRSPRDLNCLRTVECISGISTRSNHLRSAVSYQILLNCFDNKASNEEEILSLLISINVKDRSCDLSQMYIYLVLTANWLLSNPMFELKPVIYEMWGVYLRNCSCQITSTDMRPYASKVRTKASYILNGTSKKIIIKYVSLPVPKRNRIS